MRRHVKTDPEAVLLQLRGYRLTTAQILYWMPDYPSLLQVFIWQRYDLPPEFPLLRQFLSFWEDNIEGELHTVQIAHAGGIVSPTLGSVTEVFQVN